MSMPIPSKAKRVFKGIIFDVYQWKERMFDGSSATFEAISRSDTVAVIATQNDDLLLVRQRQPGRGWSYSFLGGRKERTETPLAAAKRELLEESGMEARSWKLLKVYQPHAKIDWKIHLYAARDCTQVSAPRLDAGEDIRLLKVKFPEFVRIVTSRSFWGRDVSLDVLQIKQEGKLALFKRQIFGA
jgi:ADP-ribose pyrophosphatase